MSNPYFLAAGCLAIGVGLLHTVLGELLIFRRMRAGTLVPTEGKPVLDERHVRILWASWHALTAFGLGFGAILLHFASSGPDQGAQDPVVNAIVIAMLAGSLLVLIGTKGRHPGWLGLLGVAVLAWMG